MLKFKPGDEAVCISNDFSIEYRLIVIAYWSSRKQYHVRVIRPFDDYQFTTFLPENEMELLSVYNSPLYKALS